MKSFAWLAVGVAFGLAACGDGAKFNPLFSGTGGSSAGANAGANGGSDSGGDSSDGGAADDGGAGNDSGGSNANAGNQSLGGENGGGGAGGAGGRGGSAGAAGSAGSAGAAGTGGAPATCPGAQVGCVVDWAGQFGTSASASMDGIGTAAVFGGNDASRALTGDGTYLYVAGSNCIRRIEIATADVETIAGQCGNAGFANMQGAQAQFGAVDGIATDGNTLWVNDAGNFVIREIDLSNMNVTTLSGSVGNNGLVQGNANNARYDSMLGMTSIGTSLFITEGAGVNTNNNDVRRIDSATGTASLIAGDNGTGAMNGAGNVAQFASARKLGSNGTDLYVVDTENHRIRRIVLGGGSSATHTVSTFAGSTGGYMDATGAAARFSRPRGITFDGTDLILSDSDNCVIRKITVPGAVVSTIAGTKPAGACANHAEGLGTAAEFNKPMDIYFDSGSGDLFIGEGTVIRRMYL